MPNCNPTIDPTPWPGPCAGTMDVDPGFSTITLQVQCGGTGNSGHWVTDVDATYTWARVPAIQPTGDNPTPTPAPGTFWAQGSNCCITLGECPSLTFCADNGGAAGPYLNTAIGTAEDTYTNPDPPVCWCYDGVHTTEPVDCSGSCPEEYYTFYTCQDNCTGATVTDITIYGIMELQQVIDPTTQQCFYQFYIGAVSNCGGSAPCTYNNPPPPGDAPPCSSTVSCPDDNFASNGDGTNGNLVGPIGPMSAADLLGTWNYTGTWGYGLTLTYDFTLTIGR